MKLEELIEKAQGSETEKEKTWIYFDKGEFYLTKIKPLNRPHNRESLARLYVSCMKKVPHLKEEEVNPFVRHVWNEEISAKRSKSLPGIIGDDGFLSLYATGKALLFKDFLRIWKRLENSHPVKDLNPINIEWNSPRVLFYDVDATPPGILPKLFRVWRLKKDEVLLKRIQKDLIHLAEIEDPEKRKWLTFAVLAHAAAYREIDGRALKIPSFTQKGFLVSYSCYHHLIAEGVKTLSLIPSVSDAPGIYLCEGTELWPSQPSVLGSVLANFATHGSATEAYAHSWRRIHKHLRDLRQENRPLPYVIGHSMGGSLAIQIGLYSHDLLEKAYAFNPPMPGERDYLFYHSKDKERQKKIVITANLDDFAFWRIGAKVLGEIRVFLGKKRWRYYPVSLLDCILILPAFIKFFLNVHHAFPAHQRIYALYENFVSIKLSRQEIEKEIVERCTRFDYLAFFPKLYDPTKNLLNFIRRIFRWKLRIQYLEGEIEILALHERDLIDTMTPENREEIEKELKELRTQKERLIQELRELDPK